MNMSLIIISQFIIICISIIVLIFISISSGIEIPLRKHIQKEENFSTLHEKPNSSIGCNVGEHNISYTNKLLRKENNNDIKNWMTYQTLNIFSIEKIKQIEKNKKLRKFAEII